MPDAPAHCTEYMTLSLDTVTAGYPSSAALATSGIPTVIVQGGDAKSPPAVAPFYQPNTKSVATAILRCDT